MRCCWMWLGLSWLVGCYGGPATLPTALVGENRISSNVFESPVAGPYYAGGPSTGAPGAAPPLGLGALAGNAPASTSPSSALPLAARSASAPHPLVGPLPAVPEAGSAPPLAAPDPLIEGRRAERDADLRTAQEPPLKVPEPAGFTSGAPNPGAAFGSSANRSGAIGRLFSALSSSGWETARAPANGGFAGPSTGTNGAPSNNGLPAANSAIPAAPVFTRPGAAPPGLASPPR